MAAIIFHLCAFGYIDGDFDVREMAFVRERIRELVEARAAAAGSASPETVERFVSHFHSLFETIDANIRGLFSEAVSEGEKVEDFVYAKLKLRSFEIFRTFGAENQLELLELIDKLIAADGTLHPKEAKFRAELQDLLDADVPLQVEDIEMLADDLRIAEPAVMVGPAEDHPFFRDLEEHYSRDPAALARQAELDLELLDAATRRFEEQRTAGSGALTGASRVGDLEGRPPFLDGHVYVHPIDAAEDCEVLILGDLHGCYSCLKAALLQADVFGKLEAHRLDPERHPDIRVVFLGDYIDRGRFSFNGVLRGVLRLFLSAPDKVYVLRGNHEYYLEYEGRIFGGVRPSEAIDSLVGFWPDEVFRAYLRFFDVLPNLLLFHRTLFVHAGIPRDADLREKWVDLATLNDPELRFQMLWSDPSDADYIPDELQAANARFPFGQRQFERFMTRLGCTTLVRGHEKVDEGFRSLYGDGSARLLNIFSAGGADNGDLPATSSYRQVTPMALTLKVSGGQSVMTPWVIDYRRWNRAERNAFYASPPEIPHKVR